MRKFSIALAIAASAILVACGGGGGGSTTVPAPVPAIVNANLTSFNASASTSTLVTFPVVAGADNSSTYATAGHFGSPSAECYVTQTQPRNSTTVPAGNWSSLDPTKITDSPVYVLCAQPDGSVQEVSQQLFGRQVAIQGEYPVVGDLNGDNIDDIVLFRACDCNDATTEVHIFTSHGATYTEQTINTLAPIAVSTGGLAVTNTAGKQFAVMNINGKKNIVGPGGLMLQNDGAGNFTTSQYNDPNGVLDGWQYSTAACAADFAGLGHDQLLIIDRGIPDPNNTHMQHAAIFDFNANMDVISRYDLPPAFFATLLNLSNGAHEFACRTVSLDGSSKQSIFMFTSNYYSADPVPKTYIQVYRNDSAMGTFGGMNFTDVSASALPGQSQTGGPAYSPRVVDMNNDGFLDLVLDGQTYNGTSGAQVWINNKDGTFHQVFTAELSTLYSSYAGASAVPKEFDSMLPIKVNGKWNYIVQQRTNQNGQRFGIANTQYVFK